MERELEADLDRLGRMAFGRLKHCGPLVRKFHAMQKRIERQPEPERIWNVYDWLLTPFTLWPVDFEEMAGRLLEEMGEGGKEKAERREKREEIRGQKSEGRGLGLDEDWRLLLEILPAPPAVSTQREIAEYEREIAAGRYDPMLKQRAKYDEGERALREDAKLRELWERIKGRYDVTKFQNARGVVRRRVSGERNFREGWKFNWADERSRFQELLDTLCYRWNLYGMEQKGRKKSEEWVPLLLKATVNPTPHGTLIFIPRNLSFDPRRDLDWKLIGRLHRCRVRAKQGPKLSSARLEMAGEVREAKRLWEEAGKKGMKGEARYEYVRKRMGRSPQADQGWLWRMLRKNF